MKFLSLVLLATLVHGKHEIYEGWKSYFVKPVTDEQLENLGSKVTEFDLDIVSYATLDREGVVLVKPEYQDGFLKFLEDENIIHWIHNDDLKTQFDHEDEIIEGRREQTRSEGERWIPFNNYQSLDVIYNYIDRIAQQYPQRVTLVQNANSFEGRPLKYLKISNDNFSSNKPIIYIDGAMHAREWITPPIVTYAIHKLVENVTEPDLLQNFDWIIFPVVNPDGYDHSFRNARMWRKTRSTDQHISSRLCPGVDGNRNFDFVWNTVGTSNNPCTEIYAGSRPFSEVEARAVRNIIDEYLDRMVLFITMHSYGSMILYPWGHNGALSWNSFNLHRVAVRMAQSIDSLSLPNFPNYIVGNSAVVLSYRASGAAEDYAHFRGVPLAYTYELPGLNQGFHLNPIYIRQVSIETWAGLVAGARLTNEIYG